MQLMSRKNVISFLYANRRLRIKYKPWEIWKQDFEGHFLYGTKIPNINQSMSSNSNDFPVFIDL